MIPIVVYSNKIGLNQNSHFLIWLKKSVDPSITIATDGVPHQALEAEFPIINKNDAIKVRNSVAFCFSDGPLKLMRETTAARRVVYVNTMPNLYLVNSATKRQFIRDLAQTCADYIVFPTASGIYKQLEEKIPDSTKIVVCNPYCNEQDWVSFFKSVKKEVETIAKM